MVLLNPGEMPLEADVRFDQSTYRLVWASPEQPDSHPLDGPLRVDARSAVVIMER